MKEDDDEAQQVYRGADHSDPSGAGSWIDDGGRLPQARREQCDVLLMEGHLWRHGRVAGAQAEDA